MKHEPLPGAGGLRAPHSPPTGGVSTEGVAYTPGTLRGVQGILQALRGDLAASRREASTYRLEAEGLRMTLAAIRALLEQR